MIKAASKELNKQEVIDKIMTNFSKYFNDVNAEWSSGSIDRMKEKGMFAVPTDKKFNPTGTLTRQEFAVVLDRLVTSILNNTLK
jgi:hypothetical protein